MSSAMSSCRTIVFVFSLAFVLASWPIARCDANPIPVGACCLLDGSCMEVDEDYCAYLGGTYMGDDVLCTPDPCAHWGACCLPDGTCYPAYEEDCAPYGTWLGAGTTCDPCNPCIQCYGACCWPDGTCTMETFYYCCTHGGDPDCGWECSEPRCETSSLPEEGEPQTRHATWGTIRALYR